MAAVGYLSLGSNIGDREQFLHRALLFLDHHSDIEITRVSSIYETNPVGYENQRRFLNMVVKITTTLSPHGLLKETTDIENRLGRERTIRWGPRTIDLDILLYNQENINTDTLNIPHLRMKERAFVLVPLAEVDPDIHIPRMAATPVDLIRQIGQEGVRVWKQNCGGGKFGLFEN